MHNSFHATPPVPRPHRLIHFWSGILIIAGCTAAQTCVAAQSNSEVATPTNVLDEVLVRNTRLDSLKAEIAKAEGRFYARYNELNPKDEFDIECAVDARTGTKLKRRVCLTKLQLQAKSDQGREYVQSLQAASALVVTQGSIVLGKPPDTDPMAVWTSRYDDYRENMLRLLKEHPDLQRLAEEGEQATERFNAEYKRRIKGD